jgi:small conductance mechanosensitive channel
MVRSMDDVAKATGRVKAALTTAGTVVALAAVTLGILAALGVDVAGWLTVGFGRRIVQGLFTVAVVAVLGLAGWKVAGLAIDRWLSAGGAEGRRAARMRTVGSLLRAVLAVVLWTMIGLVALSELGVDIAPLLAGAGVVGLAVGFGAQTLVKDVITGAFILFEDAVAVGDVVKVGEFAGVVEAMSIRSIRLRAFDGSVHTVPFSSVTSVTNMTKDYSFYVFDVGVAYREDTDQVAAVMREVGAGLQADPEFAPFILEPVEVVGVDRFTDSAVIVRGRIKTVPLKQWMVGREFNRRLKRRFDELGIEMPFPHLTLYFGQDKDGQAPPANVRLRPAGDDGPQGPVL